MKTLTAGQRRLTLSLLQGYCLQNAPGIASRSARHPLAQCDAGHPWRNPFMLHATTDVKRIFVALEKIAASAYGYCASSHFLPYFQARISPQGSAAALVPVFTQFVAHQGTACSAGDGACSAKQGIAGDTADDGSGAGADLGVGGVGGAGAQAQGGNKGGGDHEMSGLHGGVPFRKVEQRPRREIACVRPMSHYRSASLASL